MAIGEFGGAPAAVIGHGPMLAGPYYWLYEMSQASLNPSRAWADATRLFFKNPANPMAHTEFGKTVAAACEMFERSTRRYGKPEWRIDSTLVGGERIPVHVSTVWERPFCRLLHFERALRATAAPAAAAPFDRGAVVGPLRHPACAGPSRACCPTTTFTSPIGPTPAWCRWPPAASISTTISIT